MTRAASSAISASASARAPEARSAISRLLMAAPIEHPDGFKKRQIRSASRPFRSHYPQGLMTDAAPSSALPDGQALATLVAGKLCHDFISPAGAISSGLDLLKDPTAQDMRDD